MTTWLTDSNGNPMSDTKQTAAGRVEHTPRPWAHDPDSGEIYLDDGDVCPVIAFVNREGTSEQQAKNDGELIVRAVNYHADMRAALEKARAIIADERKTEFDSFEVNGSIPSDCLEEIERIEELDAVLEDIDAALSGKGGAS